MRAIAVPATAKKASPIRTAVFRRIGAFGDGVVGESPRVDHRIIVQRSDESVASFWQSFQKSRPVSVVLERGTNLADGVIQALLKIYKRLRPPDLLGQFLARDHLAGSPNQHRQNLGGLRLELQGTPVATQVSIAAVEFKVRESDTFERLQL